MFNSVMPMPFVPPTVVDHSGHVMPGQRNNGIPVVTPVPVYGGHGQGYGPSLVGRVHPVMPIPTPVPVMPIPFQPIPTPMPFGGYRPTTPVIVHNSHTLSGPHARMDWRVLVGVIGAIAALLLIFPFVLLV